MRDGASRMRHDMRHVRGISTVPREFFTDPNLGSGYDHPGRCEALGNLGPPRAARRAKAPLGPQLANVRPVMSPSASPGGSSPVAFT